MASKTEDEPLCPRTRAIIDELKVQDTFILDTIQNSLRTGCYDLFTPKAWSRGEVSGMPFDKAYIIAAPSLLMVSHIITSNRCSHFIDALCFGRTREVTDRNGVKRRRFSWRFDPKEQLPPGARAAVDQALKELAKVIQFEFAEMEGTSGLCYGGEPIRGPYSSRYFKDKNARTSKIHIGIKRLQDIDFERWSNYRIMHAWVELAFTILHETAHALGNARGYCGLEPFAFDQTFAELGFAIVKWVIGGRLVSSVAKFGRRDVLGYEKLPSLGMVKWYCRQMMFPTSEPLSCDSECMAFAEGEYTFNLFDNAWMAAARSSSSITAFFPPLVRCYCTPCVWWSKDSKGLVAPELREVREILTTKGVDKLSEHELETFQKHVRVRLLELRRRCLDHDHTPQYDPAEARAEEEGQRQRAAQHARNLAAK